MASVSHARLLIVMDTAENHSDNDMYVIAKTTRTPNVIRLVLTAGLFLLPRDGIKANEKIREPVAKTKSCQ